MFQSDVTDEIQEFCSGKCGEMTSRIIHSHDTRVYNIDLASLPIHREKEPLHVVVQSAFIAFPFRSHLRGFSNFIEEACGSDRNSLLGTVVGKKHRKRC